MRPLTLICNHFESLQKKERGENRVEIRIWQLQVGLFLWLSQSFLSKSIRDTKNSVNSIKWSLVMLLNIFHHENKTKEWKKPLEFPNQGILQFFTLFGPFLTPFWPMRHLITITHQYKWSLMEAFYPPHQLSDQNMTKIEVSCLVSHTWCGCLFSWWF